MANICKKNPEIFCHRLIWSLPINWCSWNILCFSFRNKSTQGKPQYIENLFQDIQYSCIKVADKAICIVNYSEIKSHTDLAPEDCIKIQENAFKLISDPCIWSRTHNLPLDAFERSASSIIAANISFLRILWGHDAVLANKAETKWCDLLRQRVSSGLGNPSQKKTPFHLGIWGEGVPNWFWHILIAQIVCHDGDPPAQIDFDTFYFWGENNSEKLV